MFLDEPTFSGYSYNRCLTGCARKRNRKQSVEMRISTLLAMTLLFALVCLRTFASGPADDQTSHKPAPTQTAATSPLEHRFRDTVRPFVETYCLGCHGKEKPKGDLDLSV